MRATVAVAAVAVTAIAETMNAIRVLMNCWTHAMALRKELREQPPGSPC